MAHRLSGVLRAAIAGAGAIALTSMASAAYAYDDGYQNVFSSVLTAVGVMPPEQSPEIDYRERAPLVLPPKQQLVKPIEPGATRTAAWPTDADVVRRRKAADDAKAPVALFEKNERAMSKDEALKYRAAQREEDNTMPSGCRAGEHSMALCRPNPDEMKAEEERYRAANPEKTDAVTAGVEPERTYLTQPPKGYMTSSKTIAATHEAPAIRRDTSSPLATYISPVSPKSVDPLNN